MQDYDVLSLLVLDLAGTFVFALSGAMAGVRKNLDIFGICVVAFAAGSAGGIMRDVFVGDIPPAAINDWKYVAVSSLAGLIIFFWYPIINRIRNPILIFDGAGLALFAVNGTQKALDFGLSPISAALLGMLTGIGGGMVRDVLSAETPVVLRSDFYATAALVGAAIVVIGHGLEWTPAISAVAGAVCCFGIRVVALRLGWALPTPGFYTQKTAHKEE